MLRRWQKENLKNILRSWWESNLTSHNPPTWKDWRMFIKAWWNSLRKMKKILISPRNFQPLLQRLLLAKKNKLEYKKANWKCQMEATLRNLLSRPMIQFNQTPKEVSSNQVQINYLTKLNQTYLLIEWNLPCWEFNSRFKELKSLNLILLWKI